MKELYYYDITEVFKNKIKQKAEDLQKDFVSCGIPFIAIFAVANDENATTYETITHSPGSEKTKLTDDKFSKIYEMLEIKADSSKEKKVINKKTEYEKNIMPKLTSLQNICIKYDIPFLYITVIKNNEDRTDYALAGVVPGVMNIGLTDDKFGYIFRLISDYAKPDDLDIIEDEDDFPTEI